MTSPDRRDDLDGQLRALIIQNRPNTSPTLDDLLARHRRTIRTRTLFAVTAVVVVTAVAGVTALLSRPTAESDRLVGPADGAPTATGRADGPLVASGPCAGLTVVISHPSGQPRWSVVPGPGNSAQMPGNALLYIEGSGPCLDQVSFRTSGLLQTASGQDGRLYTGGNGPHVGPLISHETTSGGQAQLRICLTEPDSGCTPDDAVATVTVTVTPGVLVQATQPPDPGRAELCDSYALVASNEARGITDPVAITRFKQALPADYQDDAALAYYPYGGSVAGLDTSGNSATAARAAVTDMVNANC